MAAAAKNDASSTSTRIYNKLEELEKKIDEWAKNGQMMNTELIKKLSVIETKQAAAGTTKPRSGGKAAAANGGTATNKKIFAKNSLVWLKDTWIISRDDAVKKFFSNDQMTSLAKFMESDEKARQKQGDARGYAEVGYLWETYIETDNTLMQKIRKEYETQKAAFDASNKTPAAKEDDAPPAPADDE